MCHSQCAILSSYVKLPEGKTISPNYNGQHVENSRVQFVHVISYCWGSAAKLKTGTYTPVTEDGSCPTWHHSKWAQVIPAMDVETMPCSMQRPPHTVAITDDISGNIIINYIRPTLANWHNIYIFIFIGIYILYIHECWLFLVFPMDGAESTWLDFTKPMANSAWAIQWGHCWRPRPQRMAQKWSPRRDHRWLMMA